MRPYGPDVNGFKEGPALQALTCQMKKKEIYKIHVIAKHERNRRSTKITKKKKPAKEKQAEQPIDLLWKLANYRR
ncbi:Os01g0805975 [Oryza sativa Japonica Group]|jgi:hypothetical protein|uniref:Os01g0805975 protein n=1 Tax=Oryza sativa subsp. japonica TaxID=39947 RepID=A0A0P0V9D5_ORYSJ|nr:hypothetical protein EE612_006357 [Oryza sativa]BAS74835.1 Os01g0805975 [Oryza sativa Japonica Group]